MENRPQLPKQSIYYVVNKCSATLKHPGLAQFAVNALAIANQADWEKEFDALMQQVHLLNLMPNDLKCILALFEANGFIRQPGVKGWITVDDVVKHMNAQCTNGQVAIAKVRNSRQFVAILPYHSGEYGIAPDDGSRYHAYGLLPASRYAISDIWIRWVDGKDHSPVKRRKGRSAKERKITIPPDHDTFHYLQKNPKERTGDCVIRAFAAALNVTWDEAMDKLTAASDHSNTTVNNALVYTQLLKKEGFHHRSPMRIHNKLLTGKEFCHELDKILLHGEKVFAFVGRNHVAAILPFLENGTTHYKIVDSWDSSDRLIGEYWVKEPTREEGRMSIEDVILVGTYVTHPLFGRGKVQSVHQSGWAAIDFPEGGFRVLDCKWIKHNCIIEGISIA